jgi:hypothetical protein
LTISTPYLSFLFQRLFLVSAERVQLPLRFEQFLHRRGTQRAGQLILQVCVARIEAKLLEIGARVPSRSRLERVHT